MTAGRRHLVAAAIGLAMVLVSTVTCLVALALAEGVTRIGPSSYDTEFIDDRASAPLLLVPVLAGVAGTFSLRVALVAGVLATVPAVLTQVEVVRRYRVSGWADGLEVLGYLVPALLLVGCLAGAGIGRLVRNPTGPPAQDQ